MSTEQEAGAMKKESLAALDTVQKTLRNLVGQLGGAKKRLRKRKTRKHKKSKKGGKRKKSRRRKSRKKKSKRRRRK